MTTMAHSTVLMGIQKDISGPLSPKEAVCAFGAWISMLLYLLLQFHLVNIIVSTSHILIRIIHHTSDY
jgi:hypothetical protein